MLTTPIPELPDDGNLKPVLAILPRYYPDPFEIMCPQDIEEHFFYTPTPVFMLNGTRYTTRTRFGKAIVFADQLQEPSWRPALIQDMVARIKRDEAFQQHVRDWPDARYYIHAVRLNIAPLVNPDYRVYHTCIWRAALVRQGCSLARFSF